MRNRKKQKQFEILRKSFGKKPDNRRNDYDDISIYYDLTKGSQYGKTLDEVTWNDLEMNRVFERINQANCYIGEQTLYRQLHILEQPEKKGGFSDDSQLESLIGYLNDNEEERLELSYALRSIGKEHENFRLPVFLFHAEELSISNVWIFQILQVLLFGSIFFGIMFNSALFYGISVCTVLVNLIIYMLNKMKYESYLYSLLCTRHMVSFGKMLSGKEKYRQHLGAGKLDSAVKELGKLTHLIGTYQTKKRAMWSADLVDILRDYIIGVTLWDFTVFKSITNIICGKLDYLLELYEFIGRIDMAISIASFRKSLPFYCSPEFDIKSELYMEKLYHPLVDQPVSNDLGLKNNCVITGSNASGKSTFIKAVAVNAILAQSIHTCMAQKYQMPAMNVMTSMTVRDDIIQGESYYIKELKYLKRIVDEVTPDTVTLCIIDEILRGTNTQERLAASQAILSYLAGRNCLVIVATHDMELAKSLEGQYQCLHFSNFIENGTIVFDYKIKTGYSQTQNAIKLLKYIGFPENIVTMAESKADLNPAP